MTKNTKSFIRCMSKMYKAIQILGGKCEICGESRIYRLCFHHTNLNTKEYQISSIKDYRWSTIEKEIKKCLLLCHNCHSEIHYKNTKNNRVQNNKKLYLEYKNLYGCEICGYNKCNNALCFHHKDDSIKSFQISKILYKVNSLENVKDRIMEELDKCVVLCQNCHQDLHGTLFHKYEKEIIEKSNKIKESKKIDLEIVKKMYFEENKKQIEIVKYFGCSKGHISNLIKKLTNSKNNI